MSKEVIGSPLKIFTTGQISRLCRTSPRTVCKWFDSGKLEGYRIAGSQDRRVPEQSLRNFLEQNNMPTLEELLNGRTEVRVVWVGRVILPIFDAQHIETYSLFDVGYECHRLKPQVVIIDTTGCGGGSVVEELVLRLNRLPQPRPEIIVICPEDGEGQYQSLKAENLVANVCPWPGQADVLIPMIEQLLNRKKHL